MKLSSLTVIVQYRRELKDLRTARNAIASSSGTMSCTRWLDGVEHNFVAVLGAAAIKSDLAARLDMRIAEVVRNLEAHGIVVDE